MNEGSYDFRDLPQKSVLYEFESVIKTKVIRKVIEYRLLDQDAFLYNLSLVDEVNGEASDIVVSNNQDIPKVMDTVYQTILSFFRANPNAKVVFRGSSVSRTRLYRIAITKFKADFEHEFHLFGLRDGAFEPFRSDESYEAFLVKPLNNNPK